MFPFPTFPIIPILPQTTPTQNPLKGQYTSPVSSQKPKLKPKHAIQPPPYSLRDDLQIQYQTHAKCLYWLRIAIVFSTLAISAATVGSAARALRQQSAGMSSSSPPLPLWPANLDLRQTQTALGCGALVAVASFGFLACAFWSSRSSSSQLRALNIAFTATSFLSLLASLFSAIFNGTSNATNSNTGSTLSSWACGWQTLGTTLGAPEYFKRICSETTVASDLTVLLVILEILAVAVAGCGWWMEMRMRRGGGLDDAGGEGERV